MSELETPSQIAKRHYGIFTALVLSGILFTGASLAVLEAAAANTGDASHSDTAGLVKGKGNQDERGNRSNRQGRGNRDERGNRGNRQDRGNRDDINSRDDIYSQDDIYSRSPRQQDSRTDRLPQGLANAARQDLSRQLRIPVRNLTVTDYSRETWPDGCLGLPSPDRYCTQALVEGWRIVLSDGSQNWIYRSDANGRILRLEHQTAYGTLNPTQIPTSELPPPLPANVLLRARVSGGITGDTYETIVTNNGRVIRNRVNSRYGRTSQAQSYTISRQQLRQLQRDLQELSQFDRLNYPAPRGSADYITVTLTSRYGTTRYADIVQNSLPESLQRVVQSWNQLANRI